ncbi:MAG: hypothetical protein KKH94_02390 [Candidatus Omnitrophica bacterium]|nr:hypothetical protein [Candidatus Omnitrophota bacterium]
MTMTKDCERLLQIKNIDWLKRDHQLMEMVTVYLSEYTTSHNFGIYCALIPSSDIEKVLSNLSWDLSIGNGLPGAVIYNKDGKQSVEYLRFGDDNGVEPLILMRDFYGIRDDYIELSEEFRLFHKLYHDRKTDQYIKIDNSGNEHLIAIIQPNCAQIRLKELRQFLAIKEMHLSIQFDYREHSEYSLEDLGLTEGSEDKRNGLMCWMRYCGKSGGICSYNAFSRLLGKKLISPLPKSKSEFWGFADELKKKYIDFIIGVNDKGEEVIHSSSPATLANNFGANPEEPHYLTPVQFRKQVLDKYYQQPRGAYAEKFVMNFV